MNGDRLTARFCRRHTGGFTLLEMMLVMVLATLILTVVQANFSALVPSAGRQGEVRHFVAALRAARGEAIREQREVTLVLNLKQHHYHRAGSEQRRSLPEGLVIHYHAPFTEVRDPSPVAISFFADGSSSGGLVELEMADERYLISIDWITGKVGYREPA